jgi:hypothetical protein
MSPDAAAAANPTPPPIMLWRVMFDFVTTRPPWCSALVTVREEACDEQSAHVGFWHLTDIPRCTLHVRFRG